MPGRPRWKIRCVTPAKEKWSGDSSSLVPRQVIWVRRPVSFELKASV
jgi:hypothetical protein